MTHRTESEPAGRKSARSLQKQFVDRCTDSSQTIDEILQELDVSPATFAVWFENEAFRDRLKTLRTYLRRTRELQVDIAALQAAGMLMRAATHTEASSSSQPNRLICVHLIRLARDAKTRKASATTETAPLFHPDLSAEDAARLMSEMNAPRET